MKTENEEWTMDTRNDEFGIKELQNKMLEILAFFIRICEDNHLTYWLVGGTCLGALRHQGFIPWDDDLDVGMPREDYEKLWKIMGREVYEGKYILCRTTRETNYHHRVMQIADITTTFIHTRSKNENIEHGVYIDVIPFDACPEGKVSRLIQSVNAIIFSVFNIQNKAEYNGGKLTGLINFVTSFLLGIIRNPDHRYRIWKKAEKRMSRYPWDQCKSVRCITSQFREYFYVYPREWFGEREAPFEGIKANVPTNADGYCKAMYGDYMVLPPKEKQIVRHNTVFIDLHHPYTMYQGQYWGEHV